MRVDRQTYLIAIGSNRRGPAGTPAKAVARFLDSAHPDFVITGHSTVHATAPLGGGTRRYANAVAAIASDLQPEALLDRLKAIERAGGRRRGRRWGDRVLDLDIIAWSGGMFATRRLAIPHPAFRGRRFVLGPLVEIAADWRDPVTGRSARQLCVRLDRAAPARIGPTRPRAGP